MLTYPNINPVIIHIYGPLAIRWYSLAYVLGILYVVNFLKKYGSKFHILKKTEVDDFIPFGIIGLIAGARMFHVFIYDWDYWDRSTRYPSACWLGCVCNCRRI